MKTIHHRVNGLQLKGVLGFNRDEYVSDEVYIQWANSLSDNMLSRKPGFLSGDIDFISIYAMEKQQQTLKK